MGYSRGIVLEVGVLHDGRSRPSACWIAVRTAAPLPWFTGCRNEPDAVSVAAMRSRMADVPSVEQSSTMISSRSMFSGSGAASTCARLRSTTVRSLYTGIRMESFIRKPQYSDHRSSGETYNEGGMSMTNDHNSRRNFVAGSAAGAGLLLLRPETVRGSQANSALTVGLLGAGRAGTAISGFFAKNEFARVAAICDIYQDQIEEASKMFSGAKTFRNYKELLASDVDAVYIATPPYLHPEHFEAAVAARKHIFCEKPAGVDVAGCKRVLAAARKGRQDEADFVRLPAALRRRLQRGLQQGEERRTRQDWHDPSVLDRRRTAGAAGSRASEEKIRNWLFYPENLGRHHRGTELPQPRRRELVHGHASGEGSRYGNRAIRKTPGNILDNLGVTFEFADGTIFSYSAGQFDSRDVPGHLRNVHRREGRDPYQPPELPVLREAERRAADGCSRRPRRATSRKDAVDAFVEGARSGNLENAAFWAVESTLTAIMARESIYSGKPWTWSRPEGRRSQGLTRSS